MSNHEMKCPNLTGAPHTGTESLYVGMGPHGVPPRGGYACALCCAARQIKVGRQVK